MSSRSYLSHFTKGGKKPLSRAERQGKSTGVLEKTEMYGSQKLNIYDNRWVTLGNEGGECVLRITVLLHIKRTIWLSTFRLFLAGRICETGVCKHSRGLGCGHLWLRSTCPHEGASDIGRRMPRPLHVQTGLCASAWMAHISVLVTKPRLQGRPGDCNCSLLCFSS